MDLVKFQKTIHLPVAKDHSVLLEAGKSYVMAGSFTNQIKSVFGKDTIENIENFEKVYGHKRYTGGDLNGKKITFWRTGGAGDILFLSPSLRKIKNLYPTSHITFASSYRFIDIYKNFKDVDRLLTLPLLSDIIDESDYYCMFEGIIEGSPEAETINAYDLFAKYSYVLGKMSDNEKLPIIELAEDDIQNAKSIMNSLGIYDKRCVGIQLSSSSVLRSFDASKLIEIAKGLTKAGYEVLFFGGQNQVEPIELVLKKIESKLAHNIAKMNPSWLTSAAIIDKCALMINPDSSLVHVSAALGTPQIALYGPFISDVRMRYYKNSVGIDAGAVCRPCFQHGQLPCKYVNPKANNVSKCFDCISSELILDIAIQILDKCIKN